MGTTPITLQSIHDRLDAAGLDVSMVGSPDTVVSGMAHDSRLVRNGELFVCLRGESFDGHEYAQAALSAGASALIVDHVLDVVAPQLVVADTRVAAGPAASAAWGDPSHSLMSIGVTGTNGKTTTTHIVAAMLEAAGATPGVIGTLHGPRTTPEGPDLHGALATFVHEGRTAVAMEVSSHALELHRVDGTVFDVVGFTNFGHDHLDLHGTPEDYFRAKSLLFTSVFAPVAVINVDDPHGRLLADAVADRAGTDSMRVVEITLDDVDQLVVESDRHSYRWRGHDIDVPLGGSFNVANSMLALSMVAELDVDLDRAIAGLSTLAPVPGRFETVDSAYARERGITVIIDYAHTPDGLAQLLESARPLTTGRLIAVFGCAGRRDREKRPVMGEIAARLADIALATSDNPRGEDPTEIINDVIAGVAEQYRSRVISEPDRRIAIRRGVALAERGDMVVIAGKGHENTQDLGDTVIDFDDRTVACEELAAAPSIVGEGSP